MWSSIFPSSLAILALVACGGQDPDISVEVTRTDTSADVSITVSSPGFADVGVTGVFDGEGGTSRTVGIYIDERPAELKVVFFQTAPPGCTEVHLDFALPVSWSYDISTAELDCDGCTKVDCE